MKRLAIAIAATFTAIAPAAFAQYDRGYDRNAYDSRYDNRDSRDYRDYRNRDRDWRGERARVLETKAVTDTSGQRQECWNPRAGHYEEVRDPNDHSDKRNIAGTVIGGVLGGVLGHQLGSGRGNDVATVGGAALGAYAGNRVENNRNDNDQPDLDRSRCRVVGVGDGNNVAGYDVRYTWQGREYDARLDHDPGRYVEIGRDVRADGTPY
jgi:uncharacterized protein YcfJ